LRRLLLLRSTMLQVTITGHSYLLLQHVKLPPPALVRLEPDQSIPIEIASAAR
jgi:hypothetical protein